jgi:hypothetical protein
MPMTLEEVEELHKRFRALAERATAEGSKPLARELIGLCREVAPSLQGKFGNVKEQVARVQNAARTFLKDINSDALMWAVGRMEGAVVAHRAEADAARVRP